MQTERPVVRLKLVKTIQTLLWSRWHTKPFMHTSELTCTATLQVSSMSLKGVTDESAVLLPTAYSYSCERWMSVTLSSGMCL